jgi:AcrR family transcriptional regulator
MPGSPPPRATTKRPTRGGKRLSREEKKARTRAALLGAAAKVFPRSGYHRTSLEEVAVEAGFSKGAIYSNFASKEDLFLAVFSEYVAESLLRADTGISTRRPLEEQARESARLYTQAADERREWRVLLMEFWVAATRDPELRAKLASHYARLRENIAVVVKRRADEQGLLMRYPDRVATAALALNEGYMIQHIIDPDRVTQETYGDLLSLFFGGLSALSEKADARIGAVGGEDLAASG